MFVVDWDSASLESCESIDGDKHAATSDKAAELDMGKTPSAFDDMQQSLMMQKAFSNMSDIPGA